MNDEHVEIRCLKCGYNLRGLAVNACPECGLCFDPDDLHTYRQPQQVKQTLLNVGAGLVVVAILFDLMALLAGLSDGGRGWAFKFPVLCLNGAAAPLLSLVALVLAIVCLVRSNGRGVIAWLVLIGALMAGLAGVWMFGLAVEAVNMV